MKDNKTLFALSNYFAKIIVFIICVLAIVSCDATKHIPQDKYLLNKNQLIVNEKKLSDPEVLSYLRQRPNTRILGFPFSLHLYNLGNPYYDRNFEKKLDSNAKRKKRFVNIFSEKQVKAMGNTLNGWNNWFLKNGNAPVIADSIQMLKSVESLTEYYINKGFFDVEVNSNTQKEDDKRINVDYHITTFDPYFIDTLNVDIKSPILDSLYKLHAAESKIIPGKQIDAQDIRDEADRLEKIFRNSGIYHFIQQNKDPMVFDIDVTTSAAMKEFTLRIKDRKVEVGDSIVYRPFEIQRIRKVEIYTDYSFATQDQEPKDTAIYNGYHFYALDKLKYNPKYLSNAIVIQPGGIYNDTDRDLTRDYLRNLQNFKSIAIQYIDHGDGTLTAKINLTPEKKRSLGFDGEFTTSNIKPFGILGKFSWMDRNMFKGAEILELSFQGSFLNTSRDVSDNDRFFNAWEIGTSAGLKIPRILFPINTTSIIPKRMTPQTNISLSLNLQRNIGLDRRNLTGVLGYTWRSSKKTDHRFELLNMQYIENLRVDQYFTIFKSEKNKLIEVLDTFPADPNAPIDPDDPLPDPVGYIKYVLDDPDNQNTFPEEYNIVQRVEERRDILIEDILVPVMSYTYNYTNREGFTDNSFSSLMVRLISSGNITTLFLKEPADGGQKKVFGLPVAQYFKPEIEYKKYWDTGLHSNLVFRGFVGAAFPYGNSTDIPFSRSYRAGGSNDIRAWGTFNLGPGSEENNLEFNTGSLKLTTNLEYRFKMFNSLNSALFIDAGNIWDITNSNVTSAEGKFNGFSSLNDIAVGSGFGLRYDLSFLVFRFDIGFKTYEPYLKTDNKWFKNYNFNRAVYNIGINYPF